MFKVRLLTLLATLLPTAALATDVSGSLAADTTWRAAGNPWVLTGDVTVPAGITLTIEPGVQVTFAETDGLGSGVDTSRVELIIDGTLAVQGTSASLVTITALGAYGTRIQGSATFDHARLDGGLFSVLSSGTTTFNNSMVQRGTECLRVTAGTLSFSNGTLLSCGQALYALGGTTNLNYSEVISNGSGSSSFFAITLSAPANLIHNTIARSPYGAIRVTSFTGTVNIYDNIIASNSNYGLAFNSTTSPSRSVHHNDVWNHSTSNYSLVTPGPGSISANPLFVGGINYRITDLSPARMGASDGTDLGALPYTGDAYPFLQGVLYSDRTLTDGNSLSGDLTVRPGVTLTLAAGASLGFAATDGQGSGTDPTKAELIIDGELVVQGTSGLPVTINATNGYGILVQGSATLDYTTLSGGNGRFGVVSAGTTTFNNSTVQGAGECLRVTGGTLSFNNGTLQNCTQAINALGGTTNLNDSLVRSSGNTSLGYHALNLSAPANLIHNTITGNPYGGIFINSFIGAVNIYDNIITSNGSYGVNFSSSTSNSPTRAVHHNNVWSHSISEYNHVTPGTGSISANPLFVSASNPRLTEYSPARLMASDGTDMGALPYTGDPSPSLQGALVADLTLSGANTLAGDLIVRPGVTLTLAQGASLTFASTDAQASGIDTGRVELIVDGSLDVQGTSASPVTLTATGAFGTRVLGSATFNNAILNGGLECLRVSSGTLSFNNGALQNCTQGLNALGGTSNLNYSLVKSSGSTSLGYHAINLAASANLVHNTITGNPYGGVFVSSFTTGAVNIYDNIITSNGSYGVNFSSSTSNSPTRSVHHNDVWSHSISDYSRVTPGAGSISADPLFVSATNFILQETSPCRNVASDGTDMGAFPYAPVTAAYVIVTPSPHTMTVQGTQQFTATAYDSSNNPLPRPITWTADPAAGSVNSGGVFTAGCTPGTYPAAVTATADGRSASVNLTLNPGAVSTVTVSPSSATVPANGTQQFTATARDACSNPLPSAPISWVITHEGGSLNSSGLFTAGTTPGTFTNTVRATSGTVFGSATVTITSVLASIEVTPSTATLPINGTQQFTATGRDSGGNTVPVTVSWSVVNGGGAIDSSGLFTAGTIAGTFAQTVRASSGTLSATASVTVSPGPIQTVAVAPASVTLPVRGTQQFSATATDAWGNTVAGTSSWSVSSASVGTIDATGAFTAGSTAGSYPDAVTATINGVSGSADVTLTASALARIVVTPDTVTLEPRGTRQFTAQGLDAGGNVVSITPVWSVANGAGSITQDGLFTATQLPGSYPNSVVATAEGFTGSASVTVVPGGVERVAISPQNPTVAVQGTVTFTAKAFDAFDNEVPQLTTTWEVINGGGTIDASGVFTAGTATGLFADTVKATLGGKSATTSVTVSADTDGDGLPDAWEVANGFDPNNPADAELDPDGDTLTNLSEFHMGANPRDADTDDDGVLDGREQHPGENTDGDTQVNVLDPDSDNDGLFDGTEMAVTSPHANTDTSKGFFVADTDPATSTDPLTADTDGDGRKDGEEDANHNGKVDPGETAPNHPDTFCSATPECGDGQVCQDGVCVDDPGGPGDGDGDGGGCGCSGSGAGASMLGLLLLSLIGRIGGRRRRA